MKLVLMVIPIGIVTFLGLMLIPFNFDDKQGSGSFQDTCESFGGIWLETKKMCQSIEFSECASMGGTFDECGSSSTPYSMDCLMTCTVP